LLARQSSNYEKFEDTKGVIRNRKSKTEGNTMVKRNTTTTSNDPLYFKIKF